jgi:hypothetical protein
MIALRGCVTKVAVRGELVEPLTRVRSSFDRLRTNGHEVLGLFAQALGGR